MVFTAGCTPPVRKSRHKLNPTSRYKANQKRDQFYGLSIGKHDIQNLTSSTNRHRAEKQSNRALRRKVNTTQSQLEREIEQHQSTTNELRSCRKKLKSEVHKNKALVEKNHALRKKYNTTKYLYDSEKKDHKNTVIECENNCIKCPAVNKYYPELDAAGKKRRAQSLLDVVKQALVKFKMTPVDLQAAQKYWEKVYQFTALPENATGAAAPPRREGHKERTSIWRGEWEKLLSPSK